MSLITSNKTESYVSKPDYSGMLARQFGISNNINSTESRCIPIIDNSNALAFRINLIEKAKSSIDAQYYSWNADIAGLYLIRKLIEAANRGVRVRLLLDDIKTFGADRRIAILNHHKNIEVRLFNPFKHRWSFRILRVFELLWSLKRLNHRMHNKLILTDNIIGLIGGRNIGDNYLGIRKDHIFKDIDLLLTGASIKGLAASFDQFWNDPHAEITRNIITIHPGKYALPSLLKKIDKQTVRASALLNDANAISKNIFNTTNENSFLPINAQVHYDSPDLEKDGTHRLYEELQKCLNNTVNSLVIVSAYFVPTDSLIEIFEKLIKRNVKIKIYTNSLASIDVIPPFSGYQKYRKYLLSLGITLYELRSNKNFYYNFFNLTEKHSKHSLHTKSIIYDQKKVYIGTLNLDPRSKNLNTEAGLLIDNSTLATLIYNTLLLDVDNNEYWRVKLQTNNKLIWTCGNITTSFQPARSIFQRIANYLYSLLPLHQHL